MWKHCFISIIGFDISGAVAFVTVFVVLSRPFALGAVFFYEAISTTFNTAIIVL
jgi:hypothetical protein